MVIYKKVEHNNILNFFLVIVHSISFKADFNPNIQQRVNSSKFVVISVLSCSSLLIILSHAFEIVQTWHNGKIEFSCCVFLKFQRHSTECDKRVYYLNWSMSELVALYCVGLKFIQKVTINPDLSVIQKATAGYLGVLFWVPCYF